MLCGSIRIKGAEERIYKVVRTGVSGSYTVESRRCWLGFPFRV